MYDKIHYKLKKKKKKESSCNAGETGLVPGSGRSGTEGNGYPLQYPCLENPTDRGAWPATENRVAKSWTWLSYEAQYVACLQFEMSPGFKSTIVTSRLSSQALSTQELVKDMWKSKQPTYHIDSWSQKKREQLLFAWLSQNTDYFT